MELSDIKFSAGYGPSIQAELRGDAPNGDRGFWIVIGGWGGTAGEAQEQIEAALMALGLDVEKLSKAA